MEIEVQDSDGAMVIALIGELVARSEQATILDLVAEKLKNGVKVFVLDLSEVPYISSLGIAVLVSTYVKVNREGGTLRLVNPRPRVAHVLDLTKVADIFKSYTSVEEALTEV